MMLRVLFDLFCYCLGNLFHAFGRRLEFSTEEVHVAFFGDGNQMDMGVRDFETHYGNPYAFARHGFFDGLGNTFGKELKACVLVIVKVKDIVFFEFWNYECVTFCCLPLK